MEAVFSIAPDRRDHGAKITVPDLRSRNTYVFQLNIRDQEEMLTGIFHISLQLMYEVHAGLIPDPFNGLFVIGAHDFVHLFEEGLKLT